MSLSTRVFALAIALTVSSVQCRSTCAQSPDPATVVNVDGQHPIQIEAAHREVWRETAADGLSVTTVTTLLGSADGDGRVRLTQGTLELVGESMVLVDTATSGGRDVYVYAEGRVDFAHQETRRSSAARHIRFRTMFPVQTKKIVTSSEADTLTHRMQRAIERMDPDRDQIRNVSATLDQTAELQLTQPEAPSTSVGLLPVPQVGQLFGGNENADVTARRIRVRPRSSQQLQLDSFLTEDVPAQQAYVLLSLIHI